MSARETSPPRDVLRWLPLVSFVGLASLAACMGYAYSQASVWPHSIYPELHPVWLGASLVFGTEAVLVVALFLASTVQAARGRFLRPPPVAVLLADAGLLVFGLAAFVLGEAESYGRVPQGTGTALLLTYIAASILLFGVAFVGHRPATRPLDRWAAILAVAHGLIGMGWGFLLALMAVAPPIVVY